MDNKKQQINHVHNSKLFTPQEIELISRDLIILNKSINSEQ